MNKKILLFFFSYLLFCVGGVFAQVGINTEAPYKLTELQIKNIVQGTDTIPKGIMIPRLTEAQRDAMDVSEVDNVNSLMIYNISEDCYNYYSKEANEWQSLCGKAGKAIITDVYCDEIKLYGNYIATVQTTMQEYIVIPVEVEKAGQYTMTVNAMFDDDTSNGYSFTGSGEFLYGGKQYVTLIAQGIPAQEHYDANDRTVGDKIEIFFNGVNSADIQCDNVRIPVTGALAEYSVRCGSGKVYGIYTVLPDKTNSDDDTHYLEFQVDVTNITGGATSGWSATTNTVNGLAFKGAGKFAAEGERQIIKLYAVSGSRANTYDPIVLTVTFQTKVGETSCNITVRPAFTRKKIAAFGSTSEYGYSAYRGASAGFLKSNKNFGNADDSTIKMVATRTPISGNATTGSWVDYNSFLFKHVAADITDANFRAIVAENPDIILIGYAASWPAGTSATSATTVALNYLNKGGIIIEFSESAGATNILNAIFGTRSIARVTNSAAGTSASIRSIETVLPSLVDPVIEGPFQPVIDGVKTTTLGGLRIAGDTENRLYGMNNLPTSGVISYGYGTDNANAPVCFRTIGQRYLYFGDGGYLTNNDNNAWLSALTEPFATTGANYEPAIRPNTTYYTSVVNSFFFGNLMAWAIEQAQYYGVNAQ